MSGKILNNTPISGENPEIHFGKQFKNSLWVEFINEKAEKWIGCFPKENPNRFDKEQKVVLQNSDLELLKQKYKKNKNLFSELYR